MAPGDGISRGHGAADKSGRFAGGGLDGSAAAAAARALAAAITKHGWKPKMASLAERGDAVAVAEVVEFDVVRAPPPPCAAIRMRTRAMSCGNIVGVAFTNYAAT